MKSRFEEEKEKYKQELCQFLLDNKITINEYSSCVHEDSIISVLFPSNKHDLDIAKRILEMFSAITRAKENVYFDVDTNIAYPFANLLIDSIKNDDNLFTAIIALGNLLTNPELRSKFVLDFVALTKSNEATDEVLNSFFELSNSEEEFSKNVDTLLENCKKILMVTLMQLKDSNKECLPDINNFELNDGMEKYCAANESMYNYIVKEGLVSSQYERKMTPKK